MRKIAKTERLDSFDVAAEAEEEERNERRVIQGRRVRFSSDGHWIDDDEQEIPAGLELIVVERATIVQKWGGDQPIETKWLAPGEKVDVDALNAAAAKEEWREGLSGLVGPWQRQVLLYLLDPLTMDRFTYVTGTVGGNMAIGDLSDRIRTMRRLRGEQVYPVVALADTHMKTRFGGRQRPHFKIVRFISLGGEGGAALSAPQAPQAPLIAGQAVKEPDLKEEMGDEIKY